MVMVPSSLAEPELASLLPQLVRAKVLNVIAVAATRVFFTTVFPPHRWGGAARVTGVTSDECER
jgi:hypothetical protein